MADKIGAAGLARPSAKRSRALSTPSRHEAPHRLPSGSAAPRLSIRHESRLNPAETASSSPGQTLSNAISALSVAGLRALLRLRRYRELGLLALATGVGSLAGVVVTTMSWITNFAHRLLYGLPSGERLSGQETLSHPALALIT